MKSLIASISLMGLVATVTVRAQLVDDGQTSTINGISTNLTGNLTVGSDLPFTTLIITNKGTVTNTLFGNIGLNANANSNQVIVTDPNSAWMLGQRLNIGNIGSYNQLVVSNGGAAVQTFAGAIGNTSSSSNNLVLVTGTNSLWNSTRCLVGFDGSFNQLLITEGGRTESDEGSIGANFSANSVGSFNTALISGQGSKWTVGGGSTFYIGNAGSFNELTITNGGKLTGGRDLRLGNSPVSSNNVVRITDTNSLLGFVNVIVGYEGGFNSILIKNGAAISDTSAYVGYNSTASNSVALVTDPRSVWTNSDLHVGLLSSPNLLIVSNGGMVIDSTGYLGDLSGSNKVVVTGSGSLWANSTFLYVGNEGSSNQLILANTGTTAANNLYVGFSPAASNNAVLVDGGNLMVTNASTTSIIDIRRGTLTVNAGLMIADNIWLTNGAQGTFMLNGGTLQTRNTTNSNGSIFVVGDGASAATLDLLGSGTHHFSNGLQILNHALLKGNGTIVGDISISNGGTFSPGASIGLLNVNGNLMLSEGSTNIFELNQTLGTNDHVKGLNSVILGGVLVVTNLSGTLTNGSTFKLFTASSYSGAFNGISAVSPGPGLKWHINRLPVDGVLQVVSFPTTPPLFAGTQTGTTNFALSAGAGAPYDPVYLLTATNLNLPITNWTRVATNHFDVDGHASFTQTINSTEPARFFRAAVE